VEGTGLGYGRAVGRNKLMFFCSQITWVSVPEGREGNRNCDRKVRLVSECG